MSNNALPPFPSDVPTAPLLRLSLSKLQSHDVAETHRLLQACEDIGFFYLDLQDTNIGTNLLTLADELFSLGEHLFSLSLDEKQKYDFASLNSYHGYKSQGAVVVDREGNLDANEFYNVSKNDILNLTPPLPAPFLLHWNRPTLKSFIHTSHAITTLLLTHLNTHLCLPPSTLPNVHLLPPSPNAEWTYVKPLPGHAIVNLGDAMVKFTNGRLRSNVHRVARPPGEQASWTRYSVVYFARAEDEVPLRRLEGGGIPKEEREEDEDEVVSSREWVLRRALGRRVDEGTGGTEGGGV
ncbi:Clavaminate synthase-like protein [Aspergillus sclerotiicarbonarius CBS 121057]|uniref:Clavaminate synthase-like protein n=1 Tax=Aspergillus sclerotiicarbonarius (strain CBS 121057 / IBT 28362) TaxID=1448318 RepID=A0A319E5V9_ASPSB|nr:Clavaminate synthase-like protein [Aspergillus sclerotiicarbonarius CBS 121057]